MRKRITEMENLRTSRGARRGTRYDGGFLCAALIVCAWDSHGTNIS